MEAHGVPVPSVIKLNVGGHIYTSTHSTLTADADSMLGGMFSGNLEPSSQDENGNFVIDADGPLFRYVLGFMRHGKLDLPKDFKDIDLLTSEARYYQNKALIAAVEEYKKQTEEVIHLNVGGTIYTTLRSTLKNYRAQNSPLAEMIDNPDAVRDFKGRYVIDRDGHVFRHVLNFIRDPPPFIATTDYHVLRHLERESFFYRIKDMSEAIDKRLKQVGTPEDVLRNPDELAFEALIRH